MKPPTSKLHKHTLFLREGDFSFLADRFPRLGASKVVRKLVAAFVDKLDRPVVDDAQLAEILADESLTPEETDR